MYLFIPTPPFLKKYLQHLLPLLTPDSFSTSCLPTAAGVAAGFGDRICILAASEDVAQDNSQLQQQAVQRRQQQQQLLRGFAAQVAASHRFLRFLVFKSQDNQDFMKWLTRGAGADTQQKQKQKQDEEQEYRPFAADFATR